MTPGEHKPCYGNLFPDVLHRDNDRTLRGKVFSLKLTTAGGLWRADRDVGADLTQWDECRRCPEFEHCYQMSLGKLVLQTAIADR
jgi:hypothetical protein